MHFVIKCRIHRHGFENEWHKHIWPKGMILSLAVCKVVIALSANKTVVLNLIQAGMEASVGSGAQVLPVLGRLNIGQLAGVWISWRGLIAYAESLTKSE